MNKNFASRRDLMLVALFEQIMYKFIDKTNNATANHEIKYSSKLKSQVCGMCYFFLLLNFVKVLHSALFIYLILSSDTNLSL